MNTIQYKVKMMIGFMLTFLRQTPYKWIASEAGRTWTNWIMIDNLTAGILATCSRARIGTFLWNACTILSTFGAHNTFGTTIGCAANVAQLTRAHGVTVDFATLTIRSTRWRITWINLIFLFYNRREKWTGKLVSKGLWDNLKKL